MKFSTYACVDYDGNYYHSITIGKQTWLKENFRGTHYANGDPIPNVSNADAWSKLTSGAYCWYNNDPVIGKIYGALYNHWVVSDSRGLIPGWRAATNDELFTMLNYLDNSNQALAGCMMAEDSNLYWIDTNPNRKRTNSSGFTALPNGFREPNGKFYDIRVSSTFWGADLMSGLANHSQIDASRGLVFNPAGYTYTSYGFGVRLMK